MGQSIINISWNDYNVSLILSLLSPILLRQSYTRQDFKPMCCVFFSLLHDTKGHHDGVEGTQRGLVKTAVMCWVELLNVWSPTRRPSRTTCNRHGRQQDRKKSKAQNWLLSILSRICSTLTPSKSLHNKWSSIRNHMAVHNKGSEHISGECVWLKKRHVKGKQKDVAIVSRT